MRAVVHLHPQTVRLLDALGEQVRLVIKDHEYYLRRIVTTPFRLPSKWELAELAASVVADGTNRLVFAQHLCLVLANSIELAHKAGTLPGRGGPADLPRPAPPIGQMS